MDERVDQSEAGPAHDALSRATPVTRRPRTGYWILTALVVAGLTGGGWYLWTHPQTEPVNHTAATPRSTPGTPQPIGFGTIDAGDIRVMLNEPGTVTSLDTVTVQTQFSGQLQEIGFQEGQAVHKGD